MGKLDLDTAGAEFTRWAAHFELPTTNDGMRKDDAEFFEAFKDKFVARVSSGILQVDDEGVLHFAPRGVDVTLKFDEPTGAIITRQEKDTDVMASRRTLAKWAGVEPVIFAQMKLRDANFCGEILSFFANT